MASKIKVLRRYADLPKPYHVHALAEMRAQTPRGAAIAGGAFIDLLLRQILEARMVAEPEIRSELFNPNGTLAGFSARIKLTYALGAIGNRMYRDLMIVRDLRNAFAHSADAFDFERDDIAKLCKELWFANTVNYHDKPKPVTGRHIFEREIHLAADLLADSMHPRHGGSQLPHMVMLGPARVPKPQSSPKKSRIRPSRGHQNRGRPSE